MKPTPRTLARPGNKAKRKADRWKAIYGQTGTLAPPQLWEGTLAHLGFDSRPGDVFYMPPTR